LGQKYSTDIGEEGRCSLAWKLIHDLQTVELVSLPASTIPGATAALSMQEQRFAGQLGGHHPYLLQLAAGLLYEACQSGRHISWSFNLACREILLLPPTSNLTTCAS
jgi:hypothetical protein